MEGQEQGQATIGPVVEALVAGWNAGDGAAYAAPFLDDADFVDIRGGHHRGREAIARGHEGILRTIYRGSRLEAEVAADRDLGGGRRVVHILTTLDSPEGPLKGRSRSVLSLVLVPVEGGALRIASAQNTLVAGGSP